MFSDLTPTVGCGNLNKYFTENNYNLLLLLIIVLSLGNKCSTWIAKATSSCLESPICYCSEAYGYLLFPALTSCTRQRRLNTMHTDKIQIGMRRLKPSTKRRFWHSITCYFMTRISEWPQWSGKNNDRYFFLFFFPALKQNRQFNALWLWTSFFNLSFYFLCPLFTRK